MPVTGTFSRVPVPVPVPVRLYRHHLCRLPAPKMVPVPVPVPVNLYRHLEVPVTGTYGAGAGADIGTGDSGYDMGYFNLNCYKGKKVQKNFLIGLKIW